MAAVKRDQGGELEPKRPPQASHQDGRRYAFVSAGCRQLGSCLTVAVKARDRCRDVGHRPLGGEDQAASLPSSWLRGVMVPVRAPAVTGAARTPAVLLAKVITACAAASDIWSSAVPEKLAKVSQAWW